MRWARASRKTPPTWSPCSWVTRIAARDSGATSSACRRRCASRRPKPQSTSTLVLRPAAPQAACTTRALPSLPLPRLAKRTLGRLSGLQLFLDEGEHPGGRRTVGFTHRLAIARANPDGGLLAARLDPDLEDLGLLLFLAQRTEQPGEEAAVLLASGIALRIDIAHEVDAI